MAKKSLTLKFGADTSKLSRAMKRLRTQITGSIGGGIRKGLGALTSFRGLAIGGLAAFGGSQVINLFRNLSPKFNKAINALNDEILGKLSVVAEKLAPLVEDFTSWISRTISAADIAGAMDYIVPKIRAFGDILAAVPDVFRDMISAVKQIPTMVRKQFAKIVNTATDATALAKAMPKGVAIEYGKRIQSVAVPIGGFLNDLFSGMPSYPGITGRLMVPQVRNGGTLRTN